MVYKFDVSDKIEQTIDRNHYCPPVFYLYEVKKVPGIASPATGAAPVTAPVQPAQPTGAHTVPQVHQKYLIRGDSSGRIALWNVNLNSSNILN